MDKVGCGVNKPTELDDAFDVVEIATESDFELAKQVEAAGARAFLGGLNVNIFSYLPGN